MGDPKRGKPKDRRNEETSPDRVRPPGLPSITAPSFDERMGRAAPDVSVTAPAADPGEEERTKTATDLDPSAYAATGDKDPDELASEFQLDGGKQLDAKGRLIAPGANQSGPATVPHGSPAAPRAPLAPEDLPATEVAVPAMARAPRKAHALTPAPPPPAAAAPEPLAPPAQKVSGQRREPGRWVLNPQGPPATSEAGAGEEPGAFDDPTVRRKPSAASRRRRRVLIAAGVAVLLALGGAAGARLGWLEQVQALVGLAAPPPPPRPPPSQPEALRLKVTSRPSNAAVRINGVMVGVTPLDRESPFAPEAELEVEVVLKGHRTWTKRFRAGESVSAHAVLKPGK